MKTTVTKQDFSHALTDLGVRPNELVMVHSSLSAFGYFDGGPDAVIEGLLEHVRAGTVVMPTYTERSLNRDDERDPMEYDPATEASIDGLISEHFRSWPEVIRQPDNPWHPIAAWGKFKTKLIVAGPYAAYDFFLEHDGSVLLLGVGHETHSFVHAMLDDAIGEGLLAGEKKVKSMLFPRLEPWFEQEEAQNKGMCGEATVRLISVNFAREAVFEALREQPDLFDAPPTEEERSRIINTTEKEK